VQLVQPPSLHLEKEKKFLIIRTLDLSAADAADAAGVRAQKSRARVDLKITKYNFK